MNPPRLDPGLNSLGIRGRGRKADAAASSNPSPTRADDVRLRDRTHRRLSTGASPL